MTEENKPSPDPGELELGSQEGSENVSTTGTGTSAEAVEAMTLEDLTKLAGREFASKEDFEKHYTNLKSFVGKKVEAPKPSFPKEIKPKEDAVSEDLSERFVTREELTMRDFGDKFPDAKKFDLVRTVFTEAALDNSTPEKLYQEKYQPLVEARLAREEAESKEKEVGTSTPSRLSADESKELESLVQQMRNPQPRSGVDPEAIAAEIARRVVLDKK